MRSRPTEKRGGRRDAKVVPGEGFAFMGRVKRGRRPAGILIKKPGRIIGRPLAEMKK